MRAPDFWQKGGAAATLLSPVGALYGLSVAFKARKARPFHPGVPVICVGNLTAGGSGKTPVAIAVAEMLRAKGHKPYFVTRGYGGSERGPALASRGHTAAVMGDEALLLARTAPTIVARDRAAGARLAREKGATVLVMDDGHQNFALHKTLSLVVVDAESGFGNGHQIPAGPLREPVAQGLARADAVILVGDGGAVHTDKPVSRARLVADCAEVRGRDVIAFAGIGRPEKFFDTLASCGARIVEARPYADHHVYSQSDIARLKAKARAENALLVTTEKDYVRLTPAEREGIVALPVVATFGEDSGLESLLDSALRRGVPPQAT